MKLTDQQGTNFTPQTLLWWCLHYPS